jgi:Mce-associated membrane protein
MADDSVVPSEAATDTESGAGDDNDNGGPGTEKASAEADREAEDSGEVGRPIASHLRLAIVSGLVLVLAVGGLTGWLGFRAYESHQLDAQRKLLLQVGRQGAVNLTTIDFERVDEDVARILDSATGTFHDDFQQRAQPFVEVVRQVKSKSVGTVTEAGLAEVNASGSDAQVLVAISVSTAIAGQPEQPPRAWRMKISVQEVGDDDVKVSNVEFVP